MVDDSLPVELWVEEIIDCGALSPMISQMVTLNEKLVEHGVAIPIRR